MPSQPKQFPLSPSQTWMWQRVRSFEELGQTTENYNRVIGYKLRGELSAQAMIGALRDVVERHEPLSMRLAGDIDRPSQLRGENPCQIDLVDLRTVPARERDDHARRAAAEFSLRSWSAFVEPPVRARLVQLADDEHVLVWVAHQLAFAGASGRIWFRELAADYRARLEHTSSSVPAVPSYFAHAAQLAARAETPVCRNGIATRLAELSGTRPLVGLPTAVHRESLSGYRLVAQLLPHCHEPAGSLSARELFVRIAAAWGRALAYFSGQEQICLWYLFDARVDAASKAMIGNFLNMVPMPVGNLANSDRTLTLKAADAAYAIAMLRANLPYQGLVDAAEPSRRPSEPVALLTSGSTINLEYYMSKEGGDGGQRLPGIEIENYPMERRLEDFVIPPGHGRNVWGMESPQLFFRRHRNGTVDGAVTFNAWLYESKFLNHLGEFFVRELEFLLRKEGMSAS